MNLRRFGFALLGCLSLSALALEQTSPATCLRLADANVCESRRSHELVLSRTTEAAGSRMQSSAELTFTSWYEEASAKVVDLPALQAIAVQFEGNVGTGVRQTLLALVAWDGDAPRILALESLDYWKHAGNAERGLKVTYQLEVGAGGPEMRLVYSLEDQGKLSRWQDVLAWDSASRRFQFRGRTWESESPLAKGIADRIQKCRDRMPIVLSGKFRGVSSAQLERLGWLNII